MKGRELFMKKNILFFVLALILMITPMDVFADDDVIITIDSKPLNFNENYGFPFIDSNYRTLVPFRITLETFGAKVDWDNDNQMAIATKDGVTVKVPIGKNYILKDDKNIAIDTVALKKNNRTYLPIRAVIEALGGSVDYDSSVNTVVIMTKPVDSIKIVNTAIEKSNKWKNYIYTVDMNMEMNAIEEGLALPIKVASTVETTIFKNPMKLKVNTTETMEMMGYVESEVVEEYIEIAGNEINMYSMEDGQWEKFVLEKNEENLALFEDFNANELINIEDISNNVKYFGNYIIDDRELMKMQISVNMQDYLKLFEQQFSNLDEDEETNNMLNEILSAMDGLYYTIWIDSKTGELAGCDIDMTNIMENILSFINESLSSEESINESMAIKKVYMTITFSNINSCEPIVIPKEAK